MFRLPTREVKIGDLLLGNFHPVRIQTMTTTDTMDTEGTIAQTIRCIEAGAELVRITAPSKKEAENLLPIKNGLQGQGYFTPLVADIHFTPNAAEIAARIVEKVRINPGNYVDKKKFELIEYTDADYAEEIDRIRERFTPLVKICKEYGTAMRIGTNHGSLSDRIMSRYGDTAVGMVESAMEFLRICRHESYHNIVLSMKSSNPQVMIEAYRLLARTMLGEFNECYPLHLGVTEAGDGEDGRIKSAIGIGTLLEEGIGDTIRVSLTEDPELEIPVCKDIVKRYQVLPPPGGGIGETAASAIIHKVEDAAAIPFHINEPRTKKRISPNPPLGSGGAVIADLSKLQHISRAHLQSIGYFYDETIDKWNISDMAADYIFTGHHLPDFALPGTLKVIVYPATWLQAGDKAQYFPIYDDKGFAEARYKSDTLNFVMVDCFSDETPVNDFTFLDAIAEDPTAVLCLSSQRKGGALSAVRRMLQELDRRNIGNPVILTIDSYWQTPDEHLIHFATEAGALLVDGYGDGICLGMTQQSYEKMNDGWQMIDNRSEYPLSAPATSGRTYSSYTTVEQFLNNTAFGILQAARVRISKTEYISCPSCGRTLFDLQETTAKIRAVTNHLKGVKIAIMGCIVNGPGEMADADFGYVGSGAGKITLYKGKEVVKRNVPSEVAVEELINLLKENEAWVEVAPVAG